MKSLSLSLLTLALGGFWSLAPQTLAGVVLFSRPTDTIRVDGNAIPIGAAATYEARVLFTAQFSGYGLIFNEHTFGVEDKQLLAGPNGNNSGGYALRGFSAGLATETPAELSANPLITSNVWHHLAYVYDGAQERLYLDGVKVASRRATGDIGDSTGYAALGSNFRQNEGRRPGFVGYLDTLRISTVARYSGDTFEVPSGDLASDGNTILLYNFNEAPGGTVVADSSPLGRTGYFGIPPGTSATAPSLTFDPVSKLDFAKSPEGWILSWQGPFRLQSATAVTGPFMDMTNSTSPFLIPTGVEEPRFFRLRL